MINLNTIKFSHYYRKFNGLRIDKPVTLLETWLTELESFSEDFLKYDTLYFENDMEKYYTLKDGKYILLFFMDCEGRLFTTIRRFTPKKLEYYDNLVGKKFKVVIQEMGYYNMSSLDFLNCVKEIEERIDELLKEKKVK